MENQIKIIEQTADEIFTLIGKGYYSELEFTIVYEELKYLVYKLNHRLKVFNEFLDTDREAFDILQYKLLPIIKKVSSIKVYAKSDSNSSLRKTTDIFDERLYQFDKMIKQYFT